jgi:hypothetical protein
VYAEVTFCANKHVNKHANHDYIAVICPYTLFGHEHRRFAVSGAQGSGVFIQTRHWRRFFRIESARLDARAEVSALVRGNVLELNLQKMDFANRDQGQQFSILYQYGDKEVVAEALTPTPEVRQTLAASQTGELPIAIQQRALIPIAPIHVSSLTRKTRT